VQDLPAKKSSKNLTVCRAVCEAFEALRRTLAVEDAAKTEIAG
jgi:hypothetical protein